MTVTVPEPLSVGIEAFLRQDEEKDLLRLITAGSVDDGKSTLIGRLLFDSKGVYEDQLAAAKKATVNESVGAIDFALLTDGLRAEREQGITIDVAYRYFSTPRRKFIIADTPGHEQYTRNMATGASTANLAIILIDAQNGVLTQSRRHAYIASLLGIQHVVVAVNKMDLVDYREDVFDRISGEFRQFVAQLRVPDLYFIPVSALRGDNIVTKSERMPWFEGASLLHHLETVHIASDRNLSEMRFPVQLAIRPNQRFRGYSGQVSSGVLRPGDSVMVLPSGRTSRIKSITTYDGDVTRAFPPMSVSVCLEDELDVSRGSMFVPPTHPPHVTRCIDARLVWMSAQPLDVRKQYIIKHTTQMVKAQVRAIRYRVNVNTLEKSAAAELHLNELGAVVIDTHSPLFVDPYLRNRATGSFVLIDPISNATVAAGMVTGRDPERSDGPPISTEAAIPDGVAFNGVSAEERQGRVGHPAMLIWVNDGATIAYAVERKLFDRGYLTHVLAAHTDGTLLVQLAENAIAAGLITVCSAGFLYEIERERARALVTPDRFVDVDASQSASTDELAEQVLQEVFKRAIPEAGIVRKTPGTVPERIGGLNQEQMHAGFTLWLTGMSGSGKSTVSQLLESRLRARGAKVQVLDGDVVRTQLCRGLGYSKEDRAENIRRIGFLCELLSRNGVVAIAAVISPYRACRDEVRARIPKFLEVYLECPLEILMERDVKGLYKKALNGEIHGFTGISDPYEAPLAPEVVIDTSRETPEAGVDKILRELQRLGFTSSDGD